MVVVGGGKNLFKGRNAGRVTVYPLEPVSPLSAEGAEKKGNISDISSARKVDSTNVESKKTTKNQEAVLTLCSNKKEEERERGKWRSAGV